MIYLDHAATTPVDERVLEAMDRAARTAWANPSAVYGAAGEARRLLRLARGDLARLVNADPAEVIFTSGGTEANNQALCAIRGGHVVLSAQEHASVLSAARRWGCEITLVRPDGRGVVSPQAVAAALRPDTRLISVQLANNESGVIQPAGEIGALARSRRVLFHCDAVQAFGHIPVDVRGMNIDLLTLSAHKFYGPKGAGCLVARQGALSRPLLAGGGQEFGLRSGTENVPAIWGMREAALLAEADMARRAQRERELLRGFLEAVTRAVSGARPLGGDAPRLPGVAALLLPGLSAERAVAELDLRGVLVSAGAACASREKGPSHVYRAMGLSEADARCVIRVSLGRATTPRDMALAAEAVLRVAGR